MAVDDTYETLDELSVRVRDWIAADPDAETRAEAEALVAAANGEAGTEVDEAGAEAAELALRGAFAGRLTFGTAGLRAELGPGPARMNRVVVSQTSAGFAAFLLQRAERGETSTPPSIVIGYDGRINSEVFARDTAEIMAGAGLRVTLLPAAMPTPVTAFAVRHLNASAGVMVTASHNPPRDNGYKVYLGDADAGSQIIPPVDGEIAALIKSAAARPFAELPRSSEYEVAGPEVQNAYVERAAAAVLAGLPREPADPAHPELAGSPVAADIPLRIAYTAMHGVGADVARRVFAAVGLPEVTPVPEQDRPDGLFPTVSFPNPEEPGALDLAFRTAREIDAELIVAHDPDADRLAIALPDPNSPDGYRRLTGNELGLLLGWRAAERERVRVRAEAAGEAPSGALSCTIVSSPALGAVARDYGLEYAETLSGFKWVSRVPGLRFGFEEAIGYLTHPEVVRDKDGILASADAIAMARECKARGLSLWGLLDEASMRFGHFSSSQVVVRLGGMAESAALAQWVREHPPTGFGGVAVAEVRDLLTPGLSAVPADVLSYTLVDGSRVMIRPSGTEPKLKVYIDTFAGTGTLEERREAAERALGTVEAALREYLAGAQG